MASQFAFPLNDMVRLSWMHSNYCWSISHTLFLASYPPSPTTNGPRQPTIPLGILNLFVGSLSHSLPVRRIPSTSTLRDSYHSPYLARMHLNYEPLTTHPSSIWIYLSSLLWWATRARNAFYFLYYERLELYWDGRLEHVMHS